MPGALDGNYHVLMDYLMIDDGMYQEMPSINTGAICGMQPKISIWSNGSADGATNDGGKVNASTLQQVAGVYKMMPSLLLTMHEQTSMLSPEWMGALPKDGATN